MAFEENRSDQISAKIPYMTQPAYFMSIFRYNIFVQISSGGSNETRSLTRAKITGTCWMYQNTFVVEDVKTNIPIALVELFDKITTIRQVDYLVPSPTETSIFLLKSQ